MKLGELIATNKGSAGELEAMRVTGPLDLEIEGIAADPARIRPGYLFAALPGLRRSGVAAVPAALRSGAVAVLVRQGDDIPVPAGVAVLSAANPRLATAQLSARLVGGVQPELVVAVTGTCGKTSTTVFARQLWTLLGHRAASIGTVGLVSPDWECEIGLTTPWPFEMHPGMAYLVEDGVDRLAIEASSEGLDQHRLDAVPLAAAAFTNLSRDHLDYHRTMGAYLAAKLRLFSELLPAGAAAVVNADSDIAGEIVAIARRRGHRLIRFGRNGEEIRLLRQTQGADGQVLELRVFGSDFAVRFPIVGRFQAENLQAALGLVIGTGADPEPTLRMVERLAGVPGRAEYVVATPSGGAVYVDYAHKPGALEAVLAAFRTQTEGRLSVLFGCGGGTDPGRRREMGEIAARLADRVIVTDDNPRREDPALIRAEILKAAPGALEIAGRAEAIRAAMRGLRSGDTLVLAGKGHETYQIVAGIKYPFVDAAVAREVAAELAGESFVPE